MFVLLFSRKFGAGSQQKGRKNSAEVEADPLGLP
jgi:hypothetical protein